MANPHIIPDEVDFRLLLTSLLALQSEKVLTLVYENGTSSQPTSVIFEPDLSVSEQATFANLLTIASSAKDFDALPNYGIWTPQEAYNNTFNAILSGADKATVDAQIDALPNTIAGMKTGLKALALEVITIRLILATALKMIAYLRNLVVKLR